jgi:hypothetical protein
MSELSGIDDRLREIQSLLMGAGAGAPPPSTPDPEAQPEIPAAEAELEAAGEPEFQTPAPPLPSGGGYAGAPAAAGGDLPPDLPVTPPPPPFVPSTPAPAYEVPAYEVPAPPPAPAVDPAVSLAERAASIAPGTVPYAATTQTAALPPEPPRQAHELAERSVIEPAEARARTIVAAAEREAARIVADARNEVDELTRQIDELVALRARIINSMPGMPAGPPAPEPPAPAPVGVAAHVPPPPPQLPSTMASWLDHGRFGSTSGTVVLTIGPFPDVVSIERFERALITIDALEEVYLRAYESGRCIFELTMRRPTPLVAEIERVSSVRITIDNETATALAATFVALAHSAGMS